MSLFVREPIAPEHVSAAAEATAAVHSSRHFMFAVACLHDLFSLADVMKPLPIHSCTRGTREPVCGGR